jgi:hypothetical protein
MFNLGLLSDAALTGLSDDEKNSLQKQATQQFLLGSLLSNDASMGLKSALSVPDQYLSGQRAITEMQQKAADRAAVANFQGRYMPTQFNEASPQYMGPVTPNVAQQQEELKAARAQGLPFNIQNALQDVLNLPTASQGPMRETISALKPTMQPSGILTNANMQPIGGLPTFDAKTGLVSRPTVQGGNVDFNISSAPGFAKATALNTIPKLKENQEFVFDRNQNAIGVRNMDGTIQAIQAVATAEQMGKGLANLQTTPTNIVDPATGRQKRVTEAQALGMPTSLSPSEIQAYEGYKPIRDAAFLGAESAKASDISLQNLQNILNRGNFKPGKFAVAQSEIASIATGLGIGGERAKLMSTDSALTVQAVSDITASRIKEMGSAISNADVTFSAGRGPQISNQEEAMQFYIDLNGVVNKRKKDYFNYVAKNPVPDVAEKWSQTSQGTSSIYEDPKLRKYLPKFPVKQGPDKGKTAYQLPTGDIVLFD